MIKFKRLTIALAALLITSATAWAQTPGTAQFTVPSTWENETDKLSAADLPTDFVAVTDESVLGNIANPEPTAKDVYLIYGFDGTKIKILPYQNGVKGSATSIAYGKGDVYRTSSLGVKLYYTTAPALDLTEVQAGKQWQIASMPAGNVTLNVEYEPAFTATFKALTANTIQAGKATVTLTDNTEGAQPQSATPDADGKLTPVYEGQTITLTAAEGYKFRSVTAKKGGALLSLQIGGILTATIYYVEGETWKQAITNHPTENAGWALDGEGDVWYNRSYMFTNGSWTSGDALIDPNASYAFEEI